jgi:hypothetical protein
LFDLLEPWEVRSLSIRKIADLPLQLWVGTFRGYQIVDVVEWSRALDVRLSEWCCSVSMVWVQIPSREEQKFDSSKI